MVQLCIGEYRGPMQAAPFLKYVEARLNRHIEELSYKVYVTDMLQAYAMAISGIGNKHPERIERWYERIEGKDKPQETRTEAQIVNDINSRLLKLGGEDV